MMLSGFSEYAFSRSDSVGAWVLFFGVALVFSANAAHKKNAPIAQVMMHPIKKRIFCKM
jgi:hypothetical protein